MAVTLKDVANEAGVSISTVSLAMNNSKKVNKKTLKKVHEIASELNYIPDFRGKSLKKKKTNTIGVIVPRVDNIFFSEIIQVLKDKAKEKEYNIFLCTTGNDEKEELKYINIFKSGQVDGVIFSCTTDKNNKIISEFAKNYCPVVYVDKIGGYDDRIPKIRSNRKNAAYKVTMHLIELGHKDIVFVGLKDDRFKGYIKAMMDSKIDINNEYIVNYCTFKGGYKAGERIINMRKLPTGIVCYNDETALAVIQCLQNNGIRIPEDFSICGIDNVNNSKYYNPPLTTVNILKREMSEKAIKILFKLMNGEEIPLEDYYIRYPVELIIRKSTSRPKH